MNLAVRTRPHHVAEEGGAVFGAEFPAENAYEGLMRLDGIDAWVVPGLHDAAVSDLACQLIEEHRGVPREPSLDREDLAQIAGPVLGCRRTGFLPPEDGAGEPSQSHSGTLRASACTRDTTVAWRRASRATFTQLEGRCACGGPRAPAAAVDRHSPEDASTAHGRADDPRTGTRKPPHGR